MRRVVGKVGGLKSENIINMNKVRLHASRTHLSLPRMRRDNQIVAAATKKVAWLVSATAMYPLLGDTSRASWWRNGDKV